MIEKRLGTHENVPFVKDNLKKAMLNQEDDLCN
jgi:hypothetical protein